MQGHIRKRGQSSWTVVVDLGRDPRNGKRKQVWRSVKGTKREAEALLRQLLHQRDLGVDQPPGKLTVGENLMSWLQNYARTSVSPTTYLPYGPCIQRHLVPALGGIPLAKRRPQHIQAYYS